MTAFDEYVERLRPLTPHVDPLAPSRASSQIQQVAKDLETVHPTTVDELAAFLQRNPDGVPTVALVVGLSQEKLKNALKHEFGTSSWRSIAKIDPGRLSRFFDSAYGMLGALDQHLNRSYTFGELLVARAGSRVSAIRAGAAGRSIEDAIEQIAMDLGLDSTSRTRFIGNGGRTAPCDLAIPSRDQPMIVVAAKGFDSTGSKLTDAVREIEEMAAVRLPRQLCLAVVDGIGWKSRINDLRRIHRLLEDSQIDGLYTLNDLEEFRTDLREFARLKGLFEPSL
ncbi:hypothetical protein [Curtobacterium oceanosedimentum]|uniref:hypothetical protein n=1 Tax=Curtobacterium oceanosedimentum TaxID=465820 RepID=UPI00339750B0